MPISDYPGAQITKKHIETAETKDPKPILIPDVVSSFIEIPNAGDYIPIASDEKLELSKKYNPYKAGDIVNFKNEPDRKRHFQGIARTSDGEYMIFSGGDHKNDASQLFVCRVPSNNNNSRAEIGLEVTEDDSQVHGLLKEIFVIDKEFWHNGGITIFDNILVAPLESDGYHVKAKYKTNKSLVKFYDISDIMNPKDLQIDISRNGTNCGTASLVRLQNGYYLCAVWTDSDPGQGPRLDIYISNSNKIKDGFKSKKEDSYSYNDHFKDKRTYQTIHLLLQDDDRLYLAGMMNSYSWAPIPSGSGKNHASLYEMDYEVSKRGSKMKFKLNGLDRIVNEKEFKGGGKRYNFNGGSGLYITPDNRLALYATHHRTTRDGKVLPCTEFYPVFKKTIITAKRDAVIELYDDANFSDRCMRIYGYHGKKEYSHYKKVFVEDEQFNDKISSIRYQIPKGKTYLLFEKDSFKGKVIKLKGTGKMEEIPNLKKPNKSDIPDKYEIPKKMGDKISSSKWE
ncbi:MAG: hypothetical protein AAGA77_05000 [Bacteroidota bacterium]